MIKIIPGDACVTLVIDRPERRNALTNAMYTDLDLALQSAQSEAGCNAIILTGSGGHFTAGNDLSEFQAERAAGDSPARSEEHTSELQSLMRNSYAVFCLKKKTNAKNHHMKTCVQNTRQL